MGQKLHILVLIDQLQNKTQFKGLFKRQKLSFNFERFLEQNKQTKTNKAHALHNTKLTLPPRP